MFLQAIFVEVVLEERFPNVIKETGLARLDGPHRESEFPESRHWASS